MADEAKIFHISNAIPETLKAADWLAKLDRGDLTAEERNGLARWLAEDPSNKDALKNLASFWYGLNAPLSRLSAIEQAGDALSNVRPGLTWRGRLRPRGMMMAAAVLMALALGTILYFVARPSDSSEYYAARVGETRTLRLADGSSITLNTNSAVRLSYVEHERGVHLLAGEAIFAVAHDSTRPFVVYASKGVVRAIGTRFAVRLEPNRVNVAVTEGRVAVARQAEKTRVVQDAMLDMTVGKNEVAEIADGPQTIKVSVSDRELDDRLSWARGQIVFHDKALQSVIDEVARYTSVRIAVDDSLKSRRITGVLEIGDINAMLHGLSEVLDARVEWISPSLIHLRAG